MFFSCSFLGFSEGPRICIGRRFALLEIKVYNGDYYNYDSKTSLIFHHVYYKIQDNYLFFFSRLSYKYLFMFCPERSLRNVASAPLLHTVHVMFILLCHKFSLISIMVVHVILILILIILYWVQQAHSHKHWWIDIIILILPMYLCEPA